MNEHAVSSIVLIWQEFEEFCLKTNLVTQKNVKNDGKEHLVSGQGGWKKYKAVLIHDLILEALSFFQKYCNVMLLNFVLNVFYSRFYNEKKYRITSCWHVWTWDHLFWLGVGTAADAVDEERQQQRQQLEWKDHDAGDKHEVLNIILQLLEKLSSSLSSSFVKGNNHSRAHTHTHNHTTAQRKTRNRKRGNNYLNMSFFSFQDNENLYRPGLMLLKK